MEAVQVERAAGLKRCHVCEEEKPRTEFWRHSGRRDGLDDRCKACCKRYAAARSQRPRLVDLKRCSECRAAKPRSEFFRNGSAADGLNSRCRACAKVYDKFYRKLTRRSLGRTEAPADDLAAALRLAREMGFDVRLKVGNYELLLSKTGGAQP